MDLNLYPMNDVLYFSPQSHGNDSSFSLFITFAISLWIIAEFLFFARWKYLEHHINTNKSMHDVNAEMSDKRRDHLLKMAAKYAQLIDGGMTKWVSSWFYGCDFKNISYENAVEYINWAFFINRNVNEQFSKFAIDCIEDHTNTKFESGHNPNLRYVHNTSDQRPIFSTYRPFIFYFALLIGQCVADFMFLYVLCFEYEIINGLKVWYKLQSHSDAQVQSKPICLIHGLGMHYLPYIPLVHALCKKSTQHDIVCIEVPWIAMSLWHFMPTSFYKFFGHDTSHSYIDSKIPAKTKDFVEILSNIEGKIHGKKSGDSLNLQLQWTLLGHSYGSFLVSGIYQFVKEQNGEYLPRMVLLDPVTLCLTDPTTVSFLVTEAKDWMTWVLQHVAARELMISCTLSKYFHWFEYNLYPEDLMNDQVEHVVVTADCDELIPHKLIGKGIENVNARNEKDVKKIHHISFNNMYHAMWLGSPWCVRNIVDAI